MIEVKMFKTLEAMKKWLLRNSEHIQYQEIFINNGYAIEYRRLRKI